MATVREVAELLEGSLRNPAPARAGICPLCRGFPRSGYERDRGCASNPEYLDAIAPISYAPGLAQLHTALRIYKEGATQEVRARSRLQLAAVLWRFLALHERCIAVAANSPGFGLVTVVPSKTGTRDDHRPHLRELVGSTCRHTADRFERLLRPTDQSSAERRFSAGRFVATRRLNNADVLLVDDTWTTGASAQSAACALKAAGARCVGLVVIGRWVRTDFEDHGARLAALPASFDWSTCALHPGAP